MIGEVQSRWTTCVCWPLKGSRRVALAGWLCVGTTSLESCLFFKLSSCQVSVSLGLMWVVTNPYSWLRDCGKNGICADSKCQKFH